MNNTMIVTLLTTLLLFVPGYAFAPATPTPQQTSSLYAEKERAKIYWANGKTQWEFEQSATYVVEPEGSKKKAVKKKAAKKGDNQPYNYERSVGKVVQIPFGRPQVQIKKNKKKKSTPIIAQSSAIPSFSNPFAKKDEPIANNKKATAASKKAKAPKFEFGKKNASKPVAAKKSSGPALKNPFAKKEKPVEVPKKSFSLKGILSKK